MLENLRGLGKFSKIRNILDSDISPAKAPRTLSSDKYFFLCGLCVSAGDNPRFGCGFAALGLTLYPLQNQKRRRGTKLTKPKKARNRAFGSWPVSTLLLVLVDRDALAL